jgi:DNA topoisomerase-3
MKENGIGRPSTRANIIETLFKRNYIVRQRKNLIPTITGIELIGTINNELLKSVELTGLWERKLRQIEKGEYETQVFLNEMKQMVYELVVEVKKENRANITIAEEIKPKPEEKAEEKKAPKKEKQPSNTENPLCPKCKNGKILKGNAAYGCSNFSNGCTFKVGFTFMDKALTEKQIFALIQKGKTPNIKGITINGSKLNGIIKLNAEFLPEFEADAVEKNITITDKLNTLICPKCKTGILLKGNTAWGCSRFREDCKFVIPFDVLQKQYNTTDLTDKIVKSLITN